MTHAVRSLARDLDSFADRPLGADGTKAAATVDNRGRRAGAFDSERRVDDDRAVRHESEILRNPDHSV